MNKLEIAQKQLNEELVRLELRDTREKADKYDTTLKQAAENESLRTNYTCLQEDCEDIIDNMRDILTDLESNQVFSKLQDIKTNLESTLLVNSF